VAVGAVLLVVTTYAGLRVVLGFDRVNADEVAAMIFRHIVAFESIFTKFYIDTTAGVAVIAVRLRMTVDTVAAGLAC